MATHARLKNEFTEEEKCHRLMNWLICIVTPLQQASIFTLSHHIPKQNKSESVLSTCKCNTGQIEIPDEELQFDFSNSELTEEQIAILLTFLRQNKDIFITGLHNLGKACLQTHDINKSTPPPVRSTFYRQTPDMRIQNFATN